jgi:hypothetical protein
MTTEEPFTTEHATIKIGVAQTDIKAVLVSNPTIEVPESTIVRRKAHDGTVYRLLVNSNSEGKFSGEAMMTKENFVAIMTANYGAPTVVSDVSTWDTTANGGTMHPVTITLPAKGGKQVIYRGVNAYGLGIKPKLDLQTHHTCEISFSVEKWETDFDTSA